MADPMIHLERALRGTIVGNRAIAEVPILDTGEVAYASWITAKEVEPAWREARALVDDIGMWSVAVTLWTGSTATEVAEALEDEQIFSRFYFQEAPNAGAGVSPKELLARSRTVDVETILETIAAGRDTIGDLEEAIENAVSDSLDRWGEAPDPAELVDARVDGRPITTVDQLERWFQEWEDARGFEPAVQKSRQGWFDPDRAILLFLPVTSGWDSLAYVNWFGTSDLGAELYIALGRSWEERFGAEIVAHWGTMLQCIVRRPPTSLEESWALAREHRLAADCTLALAGIRPRDYARALIGWDRWFLHERP